MTTATPPIRSYRDLIVWQRSLALVTSVYRLTASFPKDERFGAVAQLRRAAISIPANIADGHGRSSRGEYRNQLSMASGSINEVLTLCTISEELGFGPRAHLHPIQQELEEVRRMVVRLIHRLGEKGGKTPASVALLRE